METRRMQKMYFCLELVAQCSRATNIHVGAKVAPWQETDRGWSTWERASVPELDDPTKYSNVSVLLPIQRYLNQISMYLERCRVYIYIWSNILQRHGVLGPLLILTYKAAAIFAEIRASLSTAYQSAIAWSSKHPGDLISSQRQQ